MGLDMYLSKKTYVKQWEHQTPENRYSVSVKKGGKTCKEIKSRRISHIEEEIAYWRKANQIHGWFVNNTAEITPDIRYNVTREDLENLLDTCKKVLKLLNKSKKSTKQVKSGWDSDGVIYDDVEVYDNVDEIMELLPPTQGFFFGSDDIDEWYKENIISTIKVLEDELKDENNLYSDYEYYASW